MLGEIVEINESHIKISSSKTQTNVMNLYAKIIDEFLLEKLLHRISI